MRTIKDIQSWLPFQGSNLSLTKAYAKRYETISEILDRSPQLLNLAHHDLEKALGDQHDEAQKQGGFTYTSEMIFRLILCQTLEGASLRNIVIRVDDSQILRGFTRIHDGPMMGHSTLCQFRGAISAETWTAINRTLASAAISYGEISGDRLRLDTTAVETNIHYPTDSSLLWDCYRTLERLIGQARGLSPKFVGARRCHGKAAKRLSVKIARLGAARTSPKKKQQKTLYSQLIAAVERISALSGEVAYSLESDLKGAPLLDPPGAAERILDELRHYLALAKRVMWQATERVLHERPVQNSVKLFSIFEDHTELLIRGKAGKNIEFGHMFEIEQTGEKFITGYEVFITKPSEPDLVRPALENHRSLFGYYPTTLAADKGYWRGKDLEKLAKDVDVVCIPKKGKRSVAETAREHEPKFRLGQAFRAGVEGSFSFLKHVLSLARCMQKGWAHYSSTVGATVFAHNLAVLARC